MTEKELLHKREGKARRRRERNRIPKKASKVEKRKLIFKQAERKLEREILHLEKVSFGTEQLARFLEPLYEESKQREIERNLQDD